MIRRIVTGRGEFLVCSACPARCPIGRLHHVDLSKVGHTCAPGPTWEVPDPPETVSNRQRSSQGGGPSGLAATRG